MSPDIWKTLQRIAGELESLTGEVRADTAAIVRTDDHVEIIKQFDSLRKAVDRIEVTWPSGTVQVVEAPAIRSVVRIVEGE